MEYNLDTSIREAALNEENKQLKREIEYLKYYDNSYLKYSTLKEPEIIDINTALPKITLSMVGNTKVEQSNRFNGYHIIGRTLFNDVNNLQYNYFVDHPSLNYNNPHIQADILLTLHKHLIRSLLEIINDKK